MAKEEHFIKVQILFLSHSLGFPCLIIFYNFLFQFQSSLVGFVRCMNNLFDYRTKPDLITQVWRYSIVINETNA